jgi:formate hydrogenlyase subunit 3/multisubunit Na+/H+ antiporter MnhD subunit
MNRTGDMILSIGFFALFGLFGTLNYETIFALAPNSNELAITIISLLLIGGSLAKSAQIPLHSWLPGSMEAWLKTLIIIHLLFYKILIIKLVTLTPSPALPGVVAKQQSQVVTFLLFSPGLALYLTMNYMDRRVLFLV